MKIIIDENKIFSIERPSPNLLFLYIIRSFLSGPLIIISLPFLLFRYYTLRYHFDNEGISMKWGLLFKKEVNLTYSRIQDIHLSSGIIQRWLKLADLKIQTASGSYEAEITVEGICEYEMLRDFIYSHMRGYRDMLKTEKTETPVQSPASSDELVGILNNIAAELGKTREAIEKLNRTE